MKLDIPLDQSVALVRAAQKLNCDTAERLFAAMELRSKREHFFWFWLKEVSELPANTTIDKAKRLAAKALVTGEKIGAAQRLGRK